MTIEKQLSTQKDSSLSSVRPRSLVKMTKIIFYFFPSGVCFFVFIKVGGGIGFVVAVFV